MTTLTLPPVATEAPALVLRDANPADQAALLRLDASDDQSGALVIQARRRFFARPHAYAISRVLVAERAGTLVGVLCVSMSAVRVAGEACEVGYIFNVRVVPSRQGRGIGPILMEAAHEWLERMGASHVTGLVKTTNAPSMKMVLSLGWEVVGRFDYLRLDLSRFRRSEGACVRRVDVWQDPARAAARLDAVFFHHFVPLFLDRDLFSRQPYGGYAGSWSATVPGGAAWLSLWDDRRERGLAPDAFPVLKGYDLTLEGRAGFEAFSAIVAELGRRGLRQLLLPLRLDVDARALLAPYAEDVVEFNFCVKRLRSRAPLPPGPIYFDIRH